MTTKLFDNKISDFKILLSWRFPRKTAFWTSFLSAPKAPPLKNRKLYFYCRLAVSEFWSASRKNYTVLRVLRVLAPPRTDGACTPGNPRAGTYWRAFFKSFRHPWNMMIFLQTSKTISQQCFYPKTITRGPGSCLQMGFFAYSCVWEPFWLRFKS